MVGDAPLNRPARRPELKGMLRSPHQLLAMSGGLGLSPVAPGTLGSAGGFALFFALSHLPTAARIVVYIALIAIASVAASRTGEDLGRHDHNAIVIDETIGMSIALEFAPLTIPAMVSAFVLFRLFDVLKPWPVYLADRASGGFMVIFDDILAAAWTAAVLGGLYWLV